jgi:4-carboxymuconolactone decarboxylase
MARIPARTFEELDAEEKRIWQDVGAARSGSPGGPFAVWMHHPKIADAVNQFGNLLRTGELGRKMMEFVTLIVARDWTAQYVFAAHVPAAREYGIADDIIEAIRTRRTPVFIDAEEKLVYDTTRELLDSKHLSDESYALAEKTLGRNRLIELVTTIGFYMTASIMVNTFEIGPRHEGKRLT